MREMERLIKAKPGFSIIEAVNNPTYENSEIHIMDGERLIDVLPMIPCNYGDDLKAPPEYYNEDKVQTADGVVPIEKIIPDKTLAHGINPFHQIIYSIVSDINYIGRETIFKSLVHEYKVFPDTDVAFRIVGGILDTMHKYAIILRHYENGELFYVKGRESTTDDVYLVDFREGYDPIAWQIMNLIEEGGRVSRSRIRRMVLLDLGWLRHMSSLEMYLNNLELGELWGYRVCPGNGGNIEMVGDDFYIFKNSLEPWKTKK